MSNTRVRRGLPPLPVDDRTTHVWADLHLLPGGSEEAAFRSQIDCIAGGERIVVLGDFFDAWTGPETWSLFPALVDGLRQSAARGVEVVLVRGNRDVLMNRRDAAAVGAILADAVLWQGRPSVLLSHGDEYCLRDHAYQRLRRLLRNPLLRASIRLIPSFARRRIAARLRRHSQDAVARKPLDQLALVPEAAISALRQHRAEQAWIGHLHRPSEQDLGGGQLLRVLAAWEPEQPAAQLTDSA